MPGAGRSWSRSRLTCWMARPRETIRSRRRAPPSTGSTGAPLTPGAPPFAGGLVGHLGYELGRRLERLPAGAIDDQGLPDLRLGLHAWAIAWDGRDGRAWLAGRAIDGDGAALERALAGVRARAEGALRVPSAANRHSRA